MSLLKKYSILCLTIVVAAMLYFAWNQQWIIFNFPAKKTLAPTPSALTVTKKNIRIYFWYHDAWHHEDKELIWSTDQAYNIEYLVKALLTLLDEERIVKKHITLQSVTITPETNEIYLSFDRSPCNKENSTFEKWMLIESILKTLRENGITSEHIYFLVHHQPINDMHLDFSHPWPLQGFIPA